MSHTFGLVTLTFETWTLIKLMSDDQDAEQRPPTSKELLKWISREYFDMNGPSYRVLDHPPTPLEFSRLVHLSRPVVIKGLEFPALTKWTDDYLVQRMGGQSISVAVSPNGRADAVTSAPDGRLYFAEPFIDSMTLHDLLKKLCSDEKYVHYLQSQNGNLYSEDFFSGGEDASEFASLRADVPPEVNFVRDTLDRTPDAVNLWIGGSDSVTSIHSDPYENIYTVVRGTKHFTLLPPSEGWCLEERLYPHAVYTRTDATSELYLLPSYEAPPVRWSSISNPDLPDALPPEAHPIHITLTAGETLYLPVGWWHFVRQSGDVTIALNWWYDAELQGINWVWLNMLRGGDNVPQGN
ncbi:clavaminate synthase-like protein [Lanmaoa asiatica]|nr:clavaminate synthase-like protein [Lanmaoa asiatica]